MCIKMKQENGRLNEEKEKKEEIHGNMIVDKEDLPEALELLRGKII